MCDVLELIIVKCLKTSFHFGITGQFWKLWHDNFLYASEFLDDWYHNFMPVNYKLSEGLIKTSCLLKSLFIYSEKNNTGTSQFMKKKSPYLPS